MLARLRLILWPALAAAVVIAILISLGSWQVRRLAEKTALIATIAERVHQTPTELPPPEIWAGMVGAAVDYRPVTVTGHFLHDREVHVFTALAEPKGKLSGQGFSVLTPLERADGSIVVIDRGFVPTAAKDPASRPEGQVAGEVTVTGLLRRPQGRNWFTPADDIAHNVWFTRDALAVAAARNLPIERTLPYYVSAFASVTPAGGLPQAGEIELTFANNHLQYIVTWYGLAVVCFGVFVVFARGRLKAAAKAPPRD